MAELRLIAIAMMSAMGCRCGSKAKPQATPALASGLTAPAGWQALPELAASAKQAAAGIAVAGSEAWGDTTRGCYAAWFALRGGGAATDQMADQLVKSVTGDVAGITLRDVVKPTGETGVMSLAFERGAYHGRLRAQLATSGQITALVCYWNQREPAVCEQACARLLGSMR